MQIGSHAESHVPRFQERVGTRHPGYMIPDRLPWRHRARPSATLHEIQVRPEGRTCSNKTTKAATMQSRTKKSVSHLAEKRHFPNGI
jgi:hypothetical protein